MAKVINVYDAYYQLGYKVGQTSTMKGSAATGDRNFFHINFSGTVYSAVISYVSATSATITTLPRTQIRLINSTGSASAAKGSVAWAVSKTRGQTTSMSLTAFSVKPNQMILIRHNRQGKGAAKTGAAICTVYMRAQV